jgi:hypothetical protein
MLRDEKEPLSDPFATDSESEDNHMVADEVQEDQMVNGGDEEADNTFEAITVTRRRWGDEDEEEQEVAAVAEPAAPVDEGPLMGWSTIGKPGFAFTRGSKQDPSSLTHPVTVDFSRIKTPCFSFDRKAGTPVPPNYITKELLDKVVRIEQLLDGSFTLDEAREALASLVADLSRAEVALAKTARGRVGFIKVRGFASDVKTLLDTLERDLRGATATQEATDTIGVVLMRNEKLRNITAGHTGPAHISGSRSFKFYSDRLRTNGTVIQPDEEKRISLRGME